MAVTEDDHLGAGNALTGASLGLSRDGRTLAVAAPHEDSDARGVNGNQGNDSAFDSGAVYVFTQSGSNWVQQAYLKASNAASGDQFGFALALSGDGNNRKLTITPPGGGEPMIRAGQTLSVLKKENGRWLLARDANLLAPVAKST